MNQVPIKYSLVPTGASILEESINYTILFILQYMFLVNTVNLWGILWGKKSFQGNVVNLVLIV